MHQGKTGIISGLLLFFAAVFTAAGQGFPTIRQTSAVKTGTLPSNVRYYLAQQNSSKAYAKFVLVQKNNTERQVSRGLLSDLPHFVNRKPHEFLASRGISPGKDGYISYRDGSTIFSFEGVPSFDPSVSDSTLLLIFDLVQAFEGEQAIIVSGDFDRARLEERLKVFSLNVTPRKSAPAPGEYIWNPNAAPIFESAEDAPYRLATISCVWKAPRTPDSRLLSAQPIVSEMYARELAAVVEKRVRSRFFSEKIPFASFVSNYKSSSYSAGDERHEFIVTVAPEDVEFALVSLASIFAEIDSKGVLAQEFEDAKMQVMPLFLRRGSAAGEDLAGQCISAFLYGSNIPDRGAVRSFFEGRMIAPEREIELFNAYAGALLHPRRGLEIHCSVPKGQTVDSEQLISTFESAWEIAANSPTRYYAPHASHSDTLSLLSPKKRKCRLRSSAYDPVSGGRMLIFSNGAKVAFKQANTGGRLYFGLLLKGGYSYVPAIKRGESAFVSDVAGLFRVGGMSPEDFRNMLITNGIDCSVEASLSDVRISGSAPAAKLELLLKALFTYSRDRSPDPEAFGYYRACESLRERERFTDTRIINVIDSTFSPGFYYKTNRNTADLRSDLPSRVNEYLDAEFAKFGDGSLFVVGDIRQEVLVEVLERFLGGFSVNSRFSVRPKVNYHLDKTWSTRTAATSGSGAQRPCVSLGMAVEKPFTIKNYNAFLLASAYVQRAVTEALAPLGHYGEAALRSEVFPAERLSLYFICRPCAEDGVPQGIAPAEPEQVLKALREGINRLSKEGIPQKDFAPMKAALKKVSLQKAERPEFLIDALMLRSSQGRDIISNASSAIDAVSQQEVASLIRELDFGARVELIIK